MKIFSIVFCLVMAIGNIKAVLPLQKRTVTVTLQSKELQEGLLLLKYYQRTPIENPQLYTFRVTKGKAIIPLSIKSPIFFNATFKTSNGSSYKFVYYNKEKKSMFNSFFAFKDDVLLEEDSIYNNRAIVCKYIDQETKIFNEMATLDNINSLKIRVNEFPHSYALLSQLHNLIVYTDLSNRKGSILAALNLFGKDIRTSDYYKSVTADLRDKVLVENGLSLANIELGTPSPTKSALSKLISKPTLLVFWATWCGPCRKELSYLKQIGKEKIPYELVTVSIDENAEKWRSYLPNLEWSTENYIWNKQTAEMYGINAIPRAILVDETGKVIDSNFDVYSLK